MFYKHKNFKMNIKFLNVFKYCAKQEFTFLLIIILFFSQESFSQNFPSGFSQVKVATIYYPTAMAFAPDGRIFATEKAGIVKIIKNGNVLSTPFLQVTVDQLNERGLSGIAIDPDFNNNHYVYVYYTAINPIHNRLSRFTANGDVALPGSEHIIFDFDPSINSIHNGGGMTFGLDGKLYLAVGNDNVNSYSQDLNNYKGKILRVNSDGSVPTGNPFSGSEPAKRIWAYGLRNPWTLSIQPGSGKLFVNDVGEATWEEINDATNGGNNFGWPLAEGTSSNVAYKNPIFSYIHGYTGINDGCAITGGDFFNPSFSNYPPEYMGKYFFIDYCNNWINYLDFSNGAIKKNFATNLPGSGNYLKLGNDGNLYYFGIGQNSLYKIIYSNNNAPVFTSQPNNVTAPAGQQISFNVSVSGSDPINFQWRKNGIDIPGANYSTFIINNIQQSDAAVYSVKVSNTFGNALSNSAVLTVQDFNSNPVATINSPSNGMEYRAGDIISFSGSATDLEDINLPPSAFKWIVEFHHDIHIHPGPSIPIGVKNGSFSTAFGEPSANIYFRLILIVTDSKGLTDSAFVDIKPITSMLSLSSQPIGLSVLLNDQPHATNYSVPAVSGMEMALSASSPQTLNGISYDFEKWLNITDPLQKILISDKDTVYTAVFKPSVINPKCDALGTITREYWANITASSLAEIPFNTNPTSVSQLSVFEGPSNIAEKYGSRIRGYICAPISGNYIFWIASDNQSELWLSSNDQPANKIKIASVSTYTMSREWTKYASQQSIPIYLTSGVKYYIEAIHSEGSLGDNLAVGWQLPGGNLERPIPGSRLSPYLETNLVSPSVEITSPKTNTVFPSPSNIPINASVTGANILKVEFYQGNTKIGEDVSEPYSLTWMNVVAGNYLISAIATNSNNQIGISSKINIYVTDCSTPIITPQGSTTMCSGSVLLKANTGIGFIYQWKKDGVNITGATNSSYIASQSGDYQVKIIVGSCIGWSAPTKVKIQGVLSAAITLGGSASFCSGSSVSLFANTCSDYKYQWKRNGIDVVGANQPIYLAISSGNYQLKITKGSLNAWSEIIVVTVNNCKATQLQSNQELFPIINSSENIDSPELFQMKIFPNPSTGLFTIELNMASIKQEKISVSIINLLGEVVYYKEFLNLDNHLKERVEFDYSVAAGIYTLQARIGNQVETTSIILHK